MLSILKNTPKLTERQVAKILLQILSAIEYCHKKGIVHRDLKPENILFENKDIDSTIKIIDFGRSKILKPKEMLCELAGSVKYWLINNNEYSFITWLLR